MTATALPYREALYRAPDDLALYYRDYGARDSRRTPLLCLTGLTRNARDYHDFALREGGRRRVICPDYRGRGRSARDPDWRNYQPEVYLEDLRHLLVALNLHRVIVIGTSLGGILAMALGALQPAVLAGVVLNDIGPEVAADGLARILDYIATDRPQRDWPSAVAHLKTLFPTLGLKSEAAWTDFAEGTYRAGADGLLHFDWDTALARPLRKTADKLPPLWPLFRSLGRLPVLALRGARSDVLSEATFARMAEAKPDLRRATIPGVGHAPALDEPEAVAALDAFLADLP